MGEKMNCVRFDLKKTANYSLEGSTRVLQSANLAGAADYSYTEGGDDYGNEDDSATQNDVTAYEPAPERHPFAFTPVSEIDPSMLPPLPSLHQVAASQQQLDVSHPAAVVAAAAASAINNNTMRSKIMRSSTVSIM